MPNLQVRFDSRSDALIIGSGGQRREVPSDGSDGFFAHLEDVRSIGATGLGHALRKAAAQWDDQPEQCLTVSDIDYSLFDDEYSPATPIAFVGTSRGISLDISFFLDDFDDEVATEADIRRTTAPLLQRRGARFVSATMDPNYAASPWLWHVRIEPRTRGLTLGDVYDLGADVLALVEAISGHGLSRETVLELLRGGRPEVLLGQEEGDWLDVKAQDYDLTADRGKISLAQDVARFGNAEHGGIIVVGLGTKKTKDGELISSLRPIPSIPHGMKRHRQAIDNRLFPPPDELAVEEVPVTGGSIVVIHVPPQPEELKPFLVHGAIVGDRVEGAFISIVRRRGEASIPITAASIHNTLAAGRALLRRGTLPNDDPPEAHG